MTALAADLLRQVFVTTFDRNFPNIAAGVTIWDGAMVAIDSSGNCRPARATSSDRVLGPATRRVAPQVGAGAVADGLGVTVDASKIMRYANSAGGDAITVADIDRDCYVVDDQTVARTSAGDTRPRAGRIAAVDSSGVYVDFMAQPTRKVIVGPISFTDVSAPSSTAAAVVAPCAGRIIKIFTVLGGAITGADSIVTGKIGGVAITGTVTVANVGSGANVVNFAHPTAANTVALGSVLTADSDGASSTTATCAVYFEIESA
jgi:hypothetical protein